MIIYDSVIVWSICQLIYLDGQNGRHLADDIFKSIFMNEIFCILIRISLKFVLMVALV